MIHNYQQIKTVLAVALLALSISSCVSTRKMNSVASINELHLLGTYKLPHKMQFQGTTVGGLSSIDYDSRSGLYYMVCDDRSSYNPARFYAAKIGAGEKGIDTVQLVAAVTLMQPNGDVYPNSKKDPLHTPDPESMRYDPVHGRLVWGSEGERSIHKDTVVLEDPSVITITPGGQFVDSFMLPANMHMRATANGPRQNGVFEGMSFTDKYRQLLVNVEEPIYEDGPRAGLRDSTGWIRIIRFDVASRMPLAQYAYSIDAVPHPAIPEDAFKINGVPDILAINDHQLLIIERAFSTGRPGCSVRIYLGEMKGATDVSGLTSLRSSTFQPVTKKLLLDMDKLGLYIDNVEGVTFGPTLPNGRHTLVFVADDNFAEDEETQFYLFEIR